MTPCSTGPAAPGVQHHQLAPAGSPEADQRPVVHHFQTQDVAVEGQSPFPVGYGEVHCADAGVCGDRRAGLGRWNVGFVIRVPFSHRFKDMSLTITLQVALLFLVTASTLEFRDGRRANAYLRPRV